MKKNGFTLIELLAVIVILGILLLVAIPSVTTYINNSRKETYIDTANNIIKGAINLVNSGSLDIYDTDTTYYIPNTCISLETGGDSPFGKFDPAYVIVTYDNNSYYYYWRSRDTQGMGIKEITLNTNLKSDLIVSGIKKEEIDTNSSVGGRSKIYVLKEEDCKSFESSDLINNVDNGGNTALDPESLAAAIRDTPSTPDSSMDYGSCGPNGKFILESTVGSANPIYYYRGVVNDNNVLFANYCWKMVRTTNTGGIKLVYNGRPNGTSCNNSGSSSYISQVKYSDYNNDNAYMGYKHGMPNATNYNDAHNNSTDSAIKVFIDNWYEANLASYSSYLEDHVFCNDRSLSQDSIGKGYSNIGTNYAGRERLNVNKNPSLNCTNSNDMYSVGNGKLKYPIALLTADEVSLAGGVWNKECSYYLNIGKAWWTMTPSRMNSVYPSVFVVLENGAMYAHSGNLDGVRPSIVIKKSVKINPSTDGSPNNPYTFQ